MRVLVIPTTDWNAPLVFRHRILARALADMGHEVHVLRFELARQPSAGSTVDRVTLHETKGLKLSTDGVQNEILHYASNALRYRSSARRLIRTNGIDLIISANLLPSLSVALLAKGESIPVIYDVVDFYPDFVYRYNLGPVGSGLTRAIATALLAANLDMASSVVTPSASLAGYLQQKFPWSLRDKSLTVIPNGVDTAAFDARRFGSENASAKAPNHVNIVFVGSLEFWLDSRFVIEFVKSVRAAGQTPHLLVYGAEPLYYHGRIGSSLQALAREAKLADGSVCLHGPIPYQGVPAVLSGADICLLPFRPDLLVSQFACPLKLFEYLAMGKVIVATDLSEIRHLGSDSVICSGDPREAAARSLEIVENQSRRAEHAAKARRTAEEHDWSVVAHHLEGVMNSCS